MSREIFIVAKVKDNKISKTSYVSEELAYKDYREEVNSWLWDEVAMFKTDLDHIDEKPYYNDSFEKLAEWVAKYQEVDDDDLPHWFN